MSIEEYRLLAGLRFLLRQFAHFSEQSAKAAGIQPTQHQALLAIKGAAEPERFGIGDLAERLCIRHHSAVGLVDRLMQQGYVRRDADASDGRRARLRLCRRGNAVLERLSAAHRDELARLGPHLEQILERLRVTAAPADAAPAAMRPAAASRRGNARRGSKRPPA